MNPLFQVALVLGLIALMFARRCKVGSVLVLSSLFLLALAPGKLLQAHLVVYSIFTDPDFYRILSIVVLVSIFGSLLRHLEKLPLLIGALNGLLGSLSYVLPVLPMIIGALPMPGGAYLSAPMVDEAAASTGLSKEKLTVINHWFRHQWEYVFPLYPGFILAARLSGFTFPRLACFMAPISLGGLLFGYLFLLRDESLDRAKSSSLRPIRDLLVGLWPVIAVVSLTFANIPFVIAMGLVLLLLIIPNRLYSKDEWKSWISRAAGPDTLLMVFGIFMFSHSLRFAGITGSLPAALTALRLPLLLVLGAVPFIVGLLAGIAIGMVGISFPVLLPLTGTPGNYDIGLVTWVYVCGFAGVMLSPSHLCLALSREYFDSAWHAVFRLLIPLTFSSVLSAAALMLAHNHGIW